MHDCSDSELLYMIRQMEPLSYEALFERYEKLIWKLIHKIHFVNSEQEEAYMIGIVCFQTAVENFQERRGTQFGTYYYSILEKSLLIYRRKLMMEQVMISSLDAIREEESVNRYEQLMRQPVSKVQELNDTVHLMYKQCAPKEKQVLGLFLQGYTQKEIGNMMNISRYKVQHSLKKIRQKCERLGENKPFH